LVADGFGDPECPFVFTDCDSCLFVGRRKAWRLRRVQMDVAQLPDKSRLVCKIDFEHTSVPPVTRFTGNNEELSDVIESLLVTAPHYSGVKI
jgi:hypothetical protein